MLLGEGGEESSYCSCSSDVGCLGAEEEVVVVVPDGCCASHSSHNHDSQSQFRKILARRTPHRCDSGRRCCSPCNLCLNCTRRYQMLSHRPKSLAHHTRHHWRTGSCSTGLLHNPQVGTTRAPGPPRVSVSHNKTMRSHSTKRP